MIEYILAALAVYRVSRMLAIERGAFNLFERWRGWVFVRFGKDSWQFDGFTCPLCLSFWIALIVVCFLPFTNWIDFVLQWLAISGVASFLYKMERE